VSSADKIQVSVVIANWKGEDILTNCLRSIYEKTKTVSFEVIVVDDASPDNSVSIVQELFPQVLVLVNPQNCGYAKTNNNALPHLHGTYTLLLNNDTVFENDVLKEMVTFMDAHPDVGICGGLLLNPDGSFQHSHGSYPSAAVELLSIFPIKRFFPNLNYPAYGIVPKPSDTVLDTAYIVGADLMIRTALAHKMALYDEDFGAYSEDTDLCYRVRQAGWRIVYISSPHITHLFGYSYGNENLEKAERKQMLMLKGFIRFCQKHYSGWKAKLIFYLRLLAYQKAIFTYTVKSRFARGESRGYFQRQKEINSFGSAVLRRLLRELR
jgi:GT2 family glycosyltransferase